MEISRSILIHNLNILTQSPDGLNFETDTDGRLTLTDQATSDAAKEIITQTFTQAAELENTENRVWIEIGHKAHSLGHLIKEKTHLVPQDVRIQPLEDEVHDLLKVEAKFEKVDPYTVYIEESDLKKSGTIKNMLDDGFGGDTIPIPDLGLSKEQLDIAFTYMKTGDLPSNLSTTDCVALLEFASYLDHPSFMDEIYLQLNNLPLEQDPCLSLPVELGMQWAKARPTEECVTFLSSFNSINGTIHEIGLELIDTGHIKVSDFENIEKVETIVDPKRIHTLDLSDWNELTPEAFEKIVKACPNAVTLKVPSHFTDQHLAHIKKLSNLESLDLADCEEINDDGLKYLRGLENLQTLNLTRCSYITDDGLANLKELKNLQSLNLVGCQQISNAGLKHLQGLSNLRTLNLAGCREISNAGLVHLKGLKNLQTLDLAGCEQIDNYGLVHLKGLKNLQTLDLFKCLKITNDGLAHLNELKNLQSLNLGECWEITDDGLEHLKELKNLQTLDLAGCWEITDDGLEHLKELKNLRISTY